MGATHKINADVEVTGTLSVSSTTAVGGTVFGTSAKFGRDADNLIDFATTDNQIRFRVNGGDEANMTNAFFYPHSNDGMALGQAATSWSDLFLASGGVIGFNNGDVTLTHSSNTLTISGGAVVLDASDHVIKDGGNILDENDNTLISTSGGACNISGSAATLTNARTIGGVIARSLSKEILVLRREPSVPSFITDIPSKKFTWDGRWEITVGTNRLGNLEKIGPLGEAGLIQIQKKASTLIPKESLKSAPTLFYKEEVLASPLLNFGKGLTCRLAYKKCDLINSLATD